LAHMTVFYLQRSEGAGLRIGFTVGKMLGGAVQRNRMKRRLREAARLEATWPGPAVDVVINPKKSVITADFAVLRSEISGALDVIQKSANRR
jgi:ribonuclease P protein component